MNVILIKPLILILLSTILVISCTQDKPSKGASVGAGAAGERSALPSTPRDVPEVISGMLVPEEPVSNVPLIVNYDGRGPEGAAITYNFRWYVDDALVQEGPNPMLSPGAYKKGASVYVDIIPSSSLSTGRPFRTEAKRIGNLPPVVYFIKLNPPKPAVGDTITAVPAGEDPDGDFISFRYHWTVNGNPTTEQPTESDVFSTSGLRKKDMIVVVVTPADGESAGTPKLSSAVFLANAVPQFVSTPPTILEKGVYEYQVVARDTDGDPLTFRLVISPAEMTIDRTTGLIRWEPPKDIAGKQEVTIKIAADDGNGGIANQEYTLLVAVK